MEYRNQVYTASKSIDCELNHPVYGWIPFTADPNDTGAEFDVVELYNRMAKDPDTRPYIKPPVIPPTLEEQEGLRQAAYAAESDPLFFKYQRGDATRDEWLAKIQEIKFRYPYPK
jgi:hypothetical protein